MKRVIIFFSVLISAAIVTYFMPGIHPNITYSILIFSGFAGLVLLVEFIKSKGIALLPEQSTTVTVMAKYVTRKDEGDAENSNWKTYYNISFQTKESFQWSFSVSLELYNALMEGDEGTLVYKESKRKQIYFISFIRTK